MSSSKRWPPLPALGVTALLRCFVVLGAMEFETYEELGLNIPFEKKLRTKYDSGMENINSPGDDALNRARQVQWLALEKTTYPLPPITQPRQQPGTLQGRVTTFSDWANSTVFPGTRRTWWLYVPAQYDGHTAANLIIFNDGGGYLDPGGNYRATIVLDNLIAEGLLPVTVAVFLSPGIRPGHEDCAYTSDGVEAGDDPQRSLEYDSVTDRYSRFLLEDILPPLEARLVITRDPRRRAVVGSSSGAVGAFCAAWFRPERFGLVATHVGSFVNIRGAHNLPWVIRNTLRKPLRISMQSGEHDMDNSHGSWALGNKEIAAALRYAGYEIRFLYGTGCHFGTAHAGSNFAETLLWLFGIEPQRCSSCRVTNPGILAGLAGRLTRWLGGLSGSASEL